MKEKGEKRGLALTKVKVRDKGSCVIHSQDIETFTNPTAGD